MTDAGNPITCGNCGTENPPGEPRCQGCGLPLGASAGGSDRATEEASEEIGFFGVNDGDADPTDAGLPESSPHDDVNPRPPI